MNAFYRMFMEGGWPDYLILLLGLGAFAISVVGLIFAASNPQAGKWVSGAALLAVSALLLTGIGGRSLGLAQVDKAIAFVDAKDAEMIRYQGHKEAGACVTLSLGFAALPFLIGLAGVGLAWRAPKGRGLFGPVAALVALGCFGLAMSIHLAPLPGRDPQLRVHGE